NTLVAMDYGIAVFPEDGHDAATLFAFADKALYSHKHRANSRTSEPARTPAAAAGGPGSAPVASPSPPAASQFPTNPPPMAAGPVVPLGSFPSISRPPRGRKHERIGLEGTPALGMVRVGGKSSSVRVMNISKGGVCLVVGEVDLPESFSASLQVPMIPP